MEYQYLVSVIVPVFNREQFLDDAIQSLLCQTIDQSQMEVLLIDDGSTDASPGICDKYAAEHDNIKAYHKENGGLSDARNYGISHAHGKYFMYLDSDDTLQEDTVEAVTSFFEEHYDEIDLVTYPCMWVQGDKRTPLKHYRYNYLKESGVYDLTRNNTIYAAITQIYVCVKNMGPDNVLFSFDRDFRHEDQKYITDILLKRLKVGYCDQGAYNYNRQPDGLTGTRFFSYYLFEKTMAFWEEEFAKFPGEAPRYLQALFLSDLAWKISSDILLPYHYAPSEFEGAVERVRSLLDRVDAEVIAFHPAIDKYQASYFLREKRNCDVRCFTGPTGVALTFEDTMFYYREKIEIILLRTRFGHGSMTLYGFLKSPCFQFDDTPPTLFANVVSDEVESYVEVPLHRSSWDYYRAKNKTQQFWDFEFTLSAEESAKAFFEVRFAGRTLSTNYYFMPRAVFSNKAPTRYIAFRGEYEYWFHRNTLNIARRTPAKKRKLMRPLEKAFRKYDPKVWLVRKAARAIQGTGRKIWLYHDCKGVEKDNAYYQFIHDFGMDDGIDRYYVVNDPIQTRRHLFSDEQMKHVIRFGSKEHKMRFLAADKIITAYAERENWVPIGGKTMPYYEDIFHAEMVYLQHGVLHAHVPWKYSRDRILVDREVVSTQYEIDNLCNNYCFEPERLIATGMPRYDHIDVDAKPQRKILVAPSWRKNLVARDAQGQWKALPQVFEESPFFIELKKLLESPRLAALLERYDFSLELKLHPILASLYKDKFSLDGSRVRMAPDSVNDTDYAIFVSDFSSYRFDYVYLKRAIMYFFPDEEMFRSGMGDYRETDLPLGGMFGDLAHSADEAIDILGDLMERDGRPKEEYAKQMEGFFLYYDTNQCDRIYEALMA